MNAFAHAMSLLPTVCAPGTNDSEITRVDVRPKGVMQVETVNAEDRRWFTYAQHQLNEVVPSEDPSVCLLRELGDLAPGHDLQVLSYRPTRRIVCRDQGPGKHRVLKGYRKGRSREAARRHDLAQHLLRDSTLCTPPLMHVLASAECLAFNEVPGQVLNVDHAELDTFELIGEGIRVFQDSSEGSQYAMHGVVQELQVLDRHAQRVGSVAGELPPAWHVGRVRAGEIAPGLPAVHEGWSHRDLHDGQFLVSSDGVTLLDFDLLQRADVALDPANLLVHLTLRALQGVAMATDDSANQCARAFLDGLGRDHEVGFWERLRFYQATTFLRLYLIYRLRPRWISVLPSLLTLAERCLRDLERIRFRA